MIELFFPRMTRDVQSAVGPGHLVRRPGASWDGWFAIAIFPDGAPLKWLKAHYFRDGSRPGWHPLADVEGLGPGDELFAAWADSCAVTTLSAELPPGEPVSSAAPLQVKKEGFFSLEGSAPHYSERFSLPAEGVEMRFRFEAGWPIWWSRFGGLLTYAGQHASTDVELDRPEGQQALSGFGVMEHVCGASVPFDFARLLGFRFHWDVLAFADSVSHFDSAAGLNATVGPGLTVGVKAAARFPGRAQEAMSGLSVKYLELGRQATPGGEIAVPLKWEGRLLGRESALAYTATASTPVAPVIPGGGMLGFDFEGEWVSAAHGGRAVSGTGFNEYGDFAGALLDLAAG